MFHHVYIYVILNKLLTSRSLWCMSRYAQNAAFLGMELLNEPFNTAAAPAVPDVQVLDEYYQKGYATVRKHSATAFVVMCQVIGASDDEIVAMANLFPANDNVCIDIHQYNSFDDSFSQKSVQQNIDYVNNQRHSFLTRLNQANAYTFVGKSFPTPSAKKTIGFL